jgi:WD repeat-containing protein 61
MKLTKRFETDAHDEGVWAVSWLPHQNKLLTGSVDESVKCWEVGDDKLSLAYKRDYNYNLGVVSLDVHHTGQFAVATSLDSMITVWATQEMQGALACIEAAPTESWTVTFGPQSEEELYLALAGGTRNSVVLWKIRTEGPENYMELHAPTVCYGACRVCVGL